MPKSILVIDDEPYYLEGHILALEEAEFLVEIAESASDALERLGRTPIPDLIILDLIMPVSLEDAGPANGTSTGLHLLEQIRTNLGLVVPIIVLTVVATSETHQEVQVLEQKYGRRAVIRLKPFLPSELLELVQLLLATDPGQGDDNEQD